MSASKSKWLMLLGRVLLGGFFAMAGFNKIGEFEGTLAFMGSVGLPEMALLLWIVIAAEVLGGLALILGLWTRLAALGLIVFTALATFFFHANPEDVSLFKNIALIGGLLYVMAHGAGHVSIDCKMKKGSCDHEPSQEMPTM